jgi:hypothetical protein
MAGLNTSSHTFEGGEAFVDTANVLTKEALKNDSNSTGRSATPLATVGWNALGSFFGNISSRRDRYVVIEGTTCLPAGNL